MGGGCLTGDFKGGAGGGMVNRTDGLVFGDFLGDDTLEVDIMVFQLFQDFRFVYIL